MNKITVNLQFTQVEWVEKDIKTAEVFFRESMGINNLSKAQLSRLK